MASLTNDKNTAREHGGKVSNLTSHFLNIFGRMN